MLRASSSLWSRSSAESDAGGSAAYTSFPDVEYKSAGTAVTSVTTVEATTEAAAGEAEGPGAQPMDVAALERVLREEEQGDGKGKGEGKGEGEREAVWEEPIVAVDVALKAKVNAPVPAPAANTYAAKKTAAQGMMDIALITSNANQLRFLLEFARGSDFFLFSVTLIGISLLLQIAVGITLIFKGRAHMRGEPKSEHAKRLNNYVVVGVFLVTVINVMLAAFSVSNKNKAVAPPLAAADV